MSIKITWLVLAAVLWVVYFQFNTPFTPSFITSDSSLHCVGNKVNFYTNDYNFLHETDGELYFSNKKDATIRVVIKVDENQDKNFNGYEYRTYNKNTENFICERIDYNK